MSPQVFFTTETRRATHKFLLLLTVFFSLNTFSQEVDTTDNKSEPAAVNTMSVDLFDSAAQAKFKKVDETILKMKKRNKAVPILAKEITAPFQTEEEKVRALFVWVTNNIAFDCATYHSKKTPEGNFNYKSDEELLEKLEKYYYNYAMLILRNKKGVAEGYSILFRELCKNAGINCQLVEGRATDNKDKIKKLRKKSSFSTNHTWNKVQINGTWYYLDVTWASGYCDKKVTRFYKKFNPNYFITPLDQLFPTHAENIKLTERRNNPVGTRD